MGRRTLRCAMAHTPLSPEKDTIRAEWFRGIQNNHDVITISHALMGVASAAHHFKGWNGRLFPCDVDPEVRRSIAYIRGEDGGKADYPHLKIQPSGCCIESTVREYCQAHGVKKLGAVDVDLTETVEKVWKVLLPVLTTLASHNYKRLALLTFRNGRDQFSSIHHRCQWMSAQLWVNRLSAQVQIESATTYNSGRIGTNAERSHGSPMAIVAFRFN